MSKTKTVHISKGTSVEDENIEKNKPPSLGSGGTKLFQPKCDVQVYILMYLSIRCYIQLICQLQVGSGGIVPIPIFSRTRPQSRRTLSLTLGKYASKMTLSAIATYIPLTTYFMKSYRCNFIYLESLLNVLKYIHMKLHHVLPITI
jgi:hypothetical protein